MDRYEDGDKVIILNLPERGNCRYARLEHFLLHKVRKGDIGTVIISDRWNGPEAYNIEFINGARAVMSAESITMMPEIKNSKEYDIRISKLEQRIGELTNELIEKEMEYNRLLLDVKKMAKKNKKI